MNLVDDSRPEQQRAALEMLTTLEQQADPTGAARVGVTGAPGAGKSTLLDALVGRLRAREQTVGILAVDPSSQRSGGALLGDRFRVRSVGTDPGFYLRSMAARTRLGGLADASWASATVLASVFDWVFIETVGVGQSESDVASLADTLVFVAQPGAGDVLQFMKAGVLELPDIFVVNKSDVGAEARRTQHELEAGLALSESSENWQRPVLLASASEGKGLDELVAALDAHREHLGTSGELALRRERSRQSFVVDALKQRYGSFGLAQVGGAQTIASRVQGSTRSGCFGLVRQLGGEIEDALQKPSR